MLSYLVLSSIGARALTHVSALARVCMRACARACVRSLVCANTCVVIVRYLIRRTSYLYEDIHLTVITNIFCDSK